MKGTCNSLLVTLIKWTSFQGVQSIVGTSIKCTFMLRSSIQRATQSNAFVSSVAISKALESNALLSSISISKASTRNRQSDWRPTHSKAGFCRKGNPARYSPNSIVFNYGTRRLLIVTIFLLFMIRRDQSSKGIATKSYSPKNKHQSNASQLNAVYRRSNQSKTILLLPKGCTSLPSTCTYR